MRYRIKSAIYVEARNIDIFIRCCVFRKKNPIAQLNASQLLYLPGMRIAPDEDVVRPEAGVCKAQLSLDV